MSEAKAKKFVTMSDSRGILQSEIQPVVLEYKDRKKKNKQSVNDNEKKKYSKNLKDIQQLEGNILRVTKRSTEALSKGIDTYKQERDISATKKKDGAVDDFVDNSAKAASASMKEVSEIPMDIAESLGVKSYRKQARKSLKQVSRIIRLFRI